MKFISSEYCFILFFMFVAFILSSVILFLSYVIVYQKIDHEKISTYDCGINPFEDARKNFDIRLSRS